MKIRLFTLALVCLSLCSLVQSQEKIEQSEELLLRAIEFHGHLGPYLVLGLRVGLFANQFLGRELMKTVAFIQKKTILPNPVLLMECSFPPDALIEEINKISSFTFWSTFGKLGFRSGRR